MFLSSVRKIDWTSEDGSSVDLAGMNTSNFTATTQLFLEHPGHDLLAFRSGLHLGLPGQ